ncbi:MAG TPA: hypothetical protein VNU68_24020 [Verrucomicrobiae bacterium]|nr:hypothetical protein [Verrucomicrobiae bacterium]
MNGLKRRHKAAASRKSGATISLGPYFLHSAERGPFQPRFKWTGWALELAGDAFAARMSICGPSGRQRTNPYLSDYLVPVEQVPFRVAYIRSALPEAAHTNLLPLETVLTSLYCNHRVSKPLETFLQELHEALPFKDCDRPRVKDDSPFLAPVVAAAGFEVVDFWQYGSGLEVSIAWACPAAARSPGRKFYYYAAAAEFRPINHTLGKGRWVLPCETIFAHLLGRKLRSLQRGDPTDLLSEAGQQAALAHFKWSKTTLLTRKELKQARIDFVRQHPELHRQPRELARALRAAELYSELTELGAIVKQLPRMLEEANP